MAHRSPERGCTTRGMSLTKRPALLSTRPGGERNYALAGPGHKILFEPDPRRFRAEVAGATVLDTFGGHLLHESEILPVLYVPLDDVDAGVLERSGHTTHCPFKGDASYWHVHVGARVVENALWAYEHPEPEAAWLEGFGSLYWGKADAWYEEDEPVLGLRDPYHRVDVRRTSRRARVSARGELVAESAAAVVVFETTLPPRVYFALSDVRAGVLERTGARAACPYKGVATSWSVHGIDGGAWSYEEPLEGASGVRGLLAFAGEGIEVELEGAGALAAA
jgi:uncharacterized protein (DUF427 family)